MCEGWIQRWEWVARLARRSPREPPGHALGALVFPAPPSSFRLPFCFLLAPIFFDTSKARGFVPPLLIQPSFSFGPGALAGLPALVFRDLKSLINRRPFAGDARALLFDALSERVRAFCRQGRDDRFAYADVL